MSEYRDTLERELVRLQPPRIPFDQLTQRRDRKRREQRVRAAVLGIAIAVAVGWWGFQAIRSTDPKPADGSKPTPTPAELGIFADARGWIAYGNDQGIWAVEPTTDGSPPERIQLSERPGEPVAWSSDGTDLLIVREVQDTTQDAGADLDFFVLHADGTETRLTRDGGWPLGSISPDGSEVVYAATTQRGNEEWRSAIHVVDTDGDSDRLLRTAGLRTYPDAGTFRTAFGSPTFSPAGTEIAYFDGMGDWGNSLWVMNADGTGARALIDCRQDPGCSDPDEFSHYDNLGWSADGSYLAFNLTGGGIWIVGADGSGLTRLFGSGVHWSPTGSRLAFASGGISIVNADGSGVREVALSGHDPLWSPDGSRIAYVDDGSLYVVDLDGRRAHSLGAVQKPHGPTSGIAWNPLPSPAASEG